MEGGAFMLTACAATPALAQVGQPRRGLTAKSRGDVASLAYVNGLCGAAWALDRHRAGGPPHFLDLRRIPAV